MPGPNDRYCMSDVPEEREMIGCPTMGLSIVMGYGGIGPDGGAGQKGCGARG